MVASLTSLTVQCFYTIIFPLKQASIYDKKTANNFDGTRKQLGIVNANGSFIIGIKGTLLELVAGERFGCNSNLDGTWKFQT